MCNPSQAKLAELRDCLRDMLVSYGFSDENLIEQAIVEIVGVAKIAFSDEALKKRKGPLESMVIGLNRVEAIRSRCFERFRLNYAWNTKQGQEMLEWLLERPESETIDKFADWWWADDFRRKRRGPPSLIEIHTFWPQAFGEPEYQSESKKPAIFRAGEE